MTDLPIAIIASEATPRTRPSNLSETFCLGEPWPDEASPQGRAMGLGIVLILLAAAGREALRN